MTVLSSRSRVIGVRFSEKEYLAVQTFCVENSKRSVADLVREAVGDFIANAGLKNVSAHAESSFSHHVEQLEKEVRQLSAEMALLKASQTVQADRSNL